MLYMRRRQLNFPKEVIHMANRYMKRCPTLLVIGENKSKL